MKFKLKHAAVLLSMAWGLGGGSACSSAGGDQDEPGLAENLGVTSSQLRKGMPGALNGDRGYCDDLSHPCSIGEGDCDSSVQCQPGLICARNKLVQFGFPAGEACVPAHCINRVRDAGESQIDCGGECGSVCAPAVCKPNGARDRCSTDCLCAAGEGDCDSAAQCQPGLVCGRSKLKSFGFPSGDACVAAHCTNRVKDADEVQIDCGGSCGSSCGVCGDGVVTDQVVTSLVYSWVLTNCAPATPFALGINGTTVLSPVIAGSCTCTPGMGTQTITTPSTLALLHVGGNQFSINAVGPNMVVSWAKVVVNFANSPAITLVVDEVGAGSALAGQTDICEGGYQFNRPAAAKGLSLSHEECDDGNVLSGDSCNADCTLPG